MKILITGLVATLLLAGSADLVAQDVAKPTPALMRASFGKLPIYFIENRGVFPDEVNYYIQGADKTLFFTKEGITFRLKGKEQAWVVKLEFVGANHDVEPRGECKQQAIFSYFKGPEKDWKTGLQTFSKIVYRDLWPGIDLIYRGTVNELKYEFVVKPGADPKKICLQYLGASEIKIAESGALEVETPLGSFEDASPEAWQVTKSGLEEVALSYLLTKDGTGSRKFGFEVGSYDPSKPLVLDPAILIYCGYVGGSHADECRAVAVDNAGNAFVAGLTSCDQNSFPVKVGPDLTFNNAYGSHDAFVAKVNASGSQLIYCGYIGGIEEDSCDGIAVDTRGNAYVVGRTESDEKTFPVRTGPFVVFDSPSAPDAFVAKVNASGTGLVYCGYIGGKDRDWGYGIDVDSAGSAYVVGVTLSDAGAEGFPVKNGPGKTYNGKTDAFVAKVRADGTSLDYCGYISGKSYDTARGVAVDASGNAYVIGTTESDETVPGGMFPVKVGPDLYFNGYPPCRNSSRK